MMIFGVNKFSFFSELVPVHRGGGGEGGEMVRCWGRVEWQDEEMS